MRFIMTIFYLCLMIFGVSFAALNAEVVTLNLYFKTLSLPISVWMIAAFAFGIIMGVIIFLGRYWGLKSKFRKTKHALQLMEREIKNLREIPLKD
jgi:lipopolysaccharide assembly protein A